MFLSFRKNFLEILNQVFILKKHQKKFCKCKQLAGCAPLWLVNYFECMENPPSPTELRCYHARGWCKNCIMIEDLTSLWFFEEFCKMRSSGLQGVLQFSALSGKIKSEIMEVAGFDLPVDTVFLKNVEDEIFKLNSAKASFQVLVSVCR